MCLCILSEYMSVPHGGPKMVTDPWAWSYRRCGLPCGFWESNQGSLEDQQVLLISEPPLQTLQHCFNSMASINGKLDNHSMAIYLTEWHACLKNPT